MIRIERNFQKLIRNFFLVPFGKKNIPEALANLRIVRNSLRKAQAQNFTRWPILGTYQNVETVTFDTWDEEADFVFDYFEQRYKWFDAYVENL